MKKTLNCRSLHKEAIILYYFLRFDVYMHEKDKNEEIRIRKRSTEYAFKLTEASQINLLVKQ